MDDISVVKIPQPFNAIRELEDVQLVVSENYVIVANQFQVIASILPDVLHNVSVDHPRGDHG